MANDHYIVMTVECSRCKTKQKIHVALRTGATQMADGSIQCLGCNKYFKATLPDRIIRGPFPV